MVKEAYVSFEVAKLLKEKGFDWVCREHYYPNGIMSQIITEYNNWNDYNNISAPTHQMAMKWLRERQIDIVVFHEKLPEDCYWARIDKYPYTEHQQEPIYQTYEEAVEAALKYSLENLI